MKENVFIKSRLRLTIYYALVVAFFMVSFFFIVQWITRLAVSSEQKGELLDAARETAALQTRLIPSKSFSEEEKAQLTNERIFFYVIDNEGKIINSLKAPENWEQFVFEKIKSNSIKPGEPEMFYREIVADELERMLLTAQPIIVDGKQVATVYTGKEMTALFWSLKKGMYLFAGVATLALIIATLAGYIFSGWAIVPLQEMYERQRQFAADASHELRTPLSVLMASTDVLDNDPSITSPFLKQTIADLRDEVRKMTKLVADLLLIARSDNEALTLKGELLDIGELFARTIRLVQPLAEKNGVALTLEQEGDVTACVDEQKLKQLLMILVDNAVKYTPSGGNVKVSLKRAEKGRVRFSVSDTGIGISEDDLGKIFERFYRTDKARDRELGGNGLGLAIAKEITAMHGGSINATSKLGEGTEFTVSIKELKA